MSDTRKNLPVPRPGDAAPHGQLLVYTTEDGRVKIEVRLDHETVWLTQQHMTQLFQTSQQNISLHIQNIFGEKELVPEATHKEYLSVRREGARDVKRGADSGGVTMANEWRTAILGVLATLKTGKLDSNACVPDGNYPFFTCSQETLRTNTYSFDTECVLLAGNNAVSEK